MHTITDINGDQLKTTAVGGQLQFAVSSADQSLAARLDRFQAVGLARRILRHYGLEAAVVPTQGQIWTLESGEMVLILDDRHFVKLNKLAEVVGPVEVLLGITDQLVLLVSHRSCIHQKAA